MLLTVQATRRLVSLASEADVYSQGVEADAASLMDRYYGKIVDSAPVTGEGQQRSNDGHGFSKLHIDGLEVICKKGANLLGLNEIYWGG